MIHDAESLFDRFRIEPFRDLRGGNRSLTSGPDVGGADLEKHVFLPAHRRYNGRFFVELDTLAPGFWNELNQQPVELLFVSGLYGLLLWDEVIQDYDCHLGDYVVGKEPKQTIAGIWRRILTDVLCEFIKTERAHDRPVRHVFNLLSEELYQEVFDWERICSVPGVRVHHREFRPLAGTDALPFIARMLATQLPRFYDESALFKDGEWYSCSLQSGSAVEVNFQPAPKADMNRAIASILRDDPSLRALPDDLLQELAAAENTWQSAQSIAGFDPGACAVLYTKCVEHWLHIEMPDWYSGSRVSAYDAVRRNRDLKSLADDVNTLWRIRNRAAHSGQATTKTSVKNARNLVLRILSRGAHIEVHRSQQSNRQSV
ncbi:MAG TPA: peroxide stress protein YaaA [Terracidiphilus sp.]|nr:peroxide stress protein YaaA [Terracidiphilus sp.]